MNVPTRSIAICASVGIALAALGIHRATNKVEETLSTQPQTQGVLTQPLAARATNRKAVPETIAPSVSKQEASLSQRYSNIADGRVFVLVEWGHPERGGRYYASHVADQCQFVKEFTEHLSAPQPDVQSVGPNDYMRAAGALQKLQARCGQFSDAELAQFSKNSLFSQNPERDSLASLAEQFNMAAKTQDVRKTQEALVRVLQSKDPMLIDQLVS
ncbi:MAG: hypothetical protein ABW032_11660 [Burkholderiaceae bacterium]